MTEQELIERLADLEHRSWSRWMRYLYTLCTLNNDGSLTIPPERVRHWRREMDTPYADLSEREQGYDRQEVAHILPVIRLYASPEHDEQ